MSLTSFLLILAASLTHATWNFLSKRSSGGITFIWLIYISSAIIFLPVMAWMLYGQKVMFSFPVIAICVISGGVRLLYFIVLQTGYQKGDLSLVYPLARGCAPMFAAIGAILFLDEVPSLFSISGLILIVSGVIVITKPKFKPARKKLNLGMSSGSPPA
jgi:drug/metabolite transporter (DMT)-like permease